MIKTQLELEAQMKANLKAYFALSEMDIKTLHAGAEFGVKWAIENLGNYSEAEVRAIIEKVKEDVLLYKYALKTTFNPKDYLNKP